MAEFSQGQIRSIAAIRDAIDENDTIRDLYVHDKTFHEAVEEYCANPTCSSPLAVARYFNKKGGSFKVLAKAISDQWMGSIRGVMDAIRDADCC